MLIRNVTIADCEKALAIVNDKHGGNGNVVFRDIKIVSSPKNSVRLTLTVRNSRGPFSRTSASMFNRGRRVAACCWHGYGFFMDALPKEAVIRVGNEKRRPGDKWVDRNIGSQMSPMFYSDACDCRDNGLEDQDKME